MSDFAKSNGNSATIALTESIIALGTQVNGFASEMRQIETARVRSNRATYTLLGLLFAAICAVGAVSYQAKSLATQLHETQANVNAISSSPQGGAVANRKFQYILGSCLKRAETEKDFQSCVDEHFLLQHKCGQDVNDYKICKPFKD